MQEYPTPCRGASLILSFRPQTTLIVGAGPLAASRAFAALEADSVVIILSKGGLKDACDELKWRSCQGQLVVLDWDLLPVGSTASTSDRDIAALQHFLSVTPGITLACITDTMIGTQRRGRDSSEHIFRLLKSRNVPVNTTDMPDLCDFTFASSHRFIDSINGGLSPLQIGVTTNGQGCRIAARLRRDIVSKLPKDVGVAVSNLGQLRSLAKGCAKMPDKGQDPLEDGSGLDEICEDSGISTPNRPVPSRSDSETELEINRRRMKWVAQVSEYWPISKLASLSRVDMTDFLEGDLSQTLITQSVSEAPSLHSLLPQKRGRIFLVGSGPGHPSLLTIATHTALTKLAHLVLSDKLVPDAVLALIPKHIEVRIAKKFPGNAEGAQTEMMEAAVEAAKHGLTVVRLKQGDPIVYGRAGEEVLYFRSHGFEPLLVPGVSSALAAPSFAGIPVTQRGVAESFIVCTGVGRKGKEIQLPAYERGRSLIILMGVARLDQVVKSLMNTEPSGRREGPAYPSYTPIAIIERASMPDQRVITSTLLNIVRALDSSGEQRPPGIIFIGWAVLALHGQGDVGVLDNCREEEDKARVSKWLGGDGTPWRMQVGVDSGWEQF